MADNAKTRVPFRRRREGRTDFRTRLALVKSGVPRLVVRRSLTKISVQFISFDMKGDMVVAQATSTELAKMGWSGGPTNTSAAYLTGVLAGKRAKAKEVSSAVLDIGRAKPTKGNRMFATLKGVLDSGVEVPHSKEILPKDDRVTGTHKGGDAVKNFNDVKNKILQG